MVALDTVAPMCHWCVHLLDRRTGLACAAFPAGIPDAILASEVDHRLPYQGDNGIRYEPHPRVGPPPGHLERLFPRP